jgi:arylsulfatase A-like enzyme
MSILPPLNSVPKFLAIGASAFLYNQLVHAETSPAVLSRGDKSRPNIVFIYSDDHAYQAVGAYDDTRQIDYTPNIDLIAKEGMLFARCLVTNSLCGPARATTLTGKYPHLNGFYNNTNCRFDGSQMTFPKLLQKAGYQTAMIGKWHLVTNPTGFDYYDILVGQGVYYNPPLIKNGVKIQTTGYVTDLITNDALDWLAHRDKSKPFLLMYQNKAPHRPWEPSTEYLNFDKDRKYDPPSNLFDDYSGRGVAEHEQKMTIAQYLTKQDLKLGNPPAGLTPEQLQAWNAYYGPRNEAFKAAHLAGNDLVIWKYNRYMHDYLACVKQVDDSVGRVLKYLDDNGLSDNTIVVYSSDQGSFLGEHGWFDKRWIFEESLRAPLLVRWPGVIKPGSVNKEIVSNLDFAETFLDAAGVPVPSEMQGRSLVPLFKGETPPDWRTSFYYHYYEYPFWHNVSPHYGVVTDQYKLVHFYGPADYWELFDLKSDPHEMFSVYGQPAYAQITGTLTADLHKLETELKVPAKDPPGATGQGKLVEDPGDDH